MGPTHARLAYEIETTCERGYTTMSGPEHCIAIDNTLEVGWWRTTDTKHPN
jgi:hypothetical protein